MKEKIMNTTTHSNPSFWPQWCKELWTLQHTKDSMQFDSDYKAMNSVVETNNSPNKMNILHMR